MSIKSDEQVILFPAFAAETGPSAWTAHVRGWIYEPENSLARSALLTAFGRLFEHWFDLRTDDVGKMSAQPFFGERSAMFLVDNEGGKQLSVTIGGTTFALGTSEANGHFEGDVALTGTRAPCEWCDVRLALAPGDGRAFASKLQFIGRQGLSIVSDIDDTIKDSNVLDKRELGANTFLRDFRATPGMAALYQGWAASGPLAFHYVSGSPFQLYPALAAFAGRDRFPEGSFHLRKFRLQDGSVHQFLGDPKAFKLDTIDPLMRRFPERRFILVGDSGEQDPEVYATLASRFPRQVAAILIRDVRGEDLTSLRFVRTYKDLPDHIVRRVFRHPREIADFTPLDLLSQ
jgi:phosphatidate phosphatase APP1